VSGPCGCRAEIVDPEEFFKGADLARVVYCPLHTAAGEMLAVLKERYEMDVEAKERLTENTFNEAEVERYYARANVVHERIGRVIASATHKEALP